MQQRPRPDLILPHVPTIPVAAGQLSSGPLSSDTLVFTGRAVVYQISVGDTAALNLELNDSTDGTGVDKWGMVIPADGYGHWIFQPPLEFATGIYLDVDTATCVVTVGYKAL